MKKIIAAVVVCAAAGLWGCGASVPEETTVPLAPKPAITASQPVMPPLQGGPMLYRCWSETIHEEYRSYQILGIINQNGELVQEPIYPWNPFEYTYDFDGRVVGLVARTDDEIHFYALDGERKILKVKRIENSWDNNVTVLPGGRYAAVTISEEVVMEPVQVQHTTTVGLYDIQNETWLFAPKRGRSVGKISDGGTCFITDHKIVYGDLDEYILGFVPLSIGKDKTEGSGRADYRQPTACWELDLRSGEVKERPPLPGDISSYYANAGWYTRFVRYNGDPATDAYPMYDALTDEFIDLHGWSIHSDFFGEHAVVSSGRYPDLEFAFMNRSREIQPGRYGQPRKYGNGSGAAYMLKENDGPLRLLDIGLKTLCTVGEGEELLFCSRRSEDQRERGEFILVGADGQVKQFFGQDGETRPERAQAYSCESYKLNHGHFVYKNTMLTPFWDGEQWAVFDKERFMPPERGEEWYSPVPEVIVLVACPEYLVIETGYDVFYGDDDGDGERAFEAEELIAVDWQGNRVLDCPLLPFFQQSEDYYHNGHTIGSTAGEQGPNYYWVEKDGIRGYINTQGEWLFIDE